ncbi:MAG: stage II sporulation protein R [Defluviitaleaceae bacterium]|nr:stage II sporulation protein R [Defluviitaleaceae bacterium]
MLDKVKRVLMGEARLLMVSVCAGLAFTLIFALMTRLYAADAQTRIAESILRFHVVAHSDDEAEQELKLRVRNAVLEEYREVLANVDGRTAAIDIILGELENIERIAAEVVADGGLEHDVTARLSGRFFPMRVYGGMKFPSGMYDALTIRIGSAIGENWWCVVFPPLCFVDEAQTELLHESREQFVSVMSEQSYELVSQSLSNNNVRVRFAVVDWWQGRNSDSESEIVIVQN